MTKGKKSGRIEKGNFESQLTPAQKEIWENVKQGFIELKLAEEGKLVFRPAEELLNEIPD